MPKKPLSKPAKPAKVPVHGPQHANQVRIIGGQWKRTPLPVLSALGLRPTPDRVRETVFNWINHLVDADWGQLDCLDLFAGSGALGFEAASRGAATVTMVDSHPAVIRQLEQNKAKLKADNIRLLRADAVSSARDLAQRGQRYDLIFLDPPYQQEFLSQTLPLCKTLLKEGGLVYAESGLPLPMGELQRPEWLDGWDCTRSDKAGMVHYQLLQLHKNSA